MSSSEHRLEVVVYQKGGMVNLCEDLPDLFRLARAALDDDRGGPRLPAV